MHVPFRLPPAARPIDVLTVGENSRDLVAGVAPYPARNVKQRLSSWAELPGGEAATAAVALARLGCRTEYVGRFGDDPFGIAGIACLSKAGVAVDRVVTRAGATSRFAVILVDRASGARTVLWDRHPEMALESDDVPDAALAAARVALIGSQEPAAAAAIAERARRADTRTVVDVERVQPGVDHLLRHIDVIVASEGFPSALTGVQQTGAALAALQRQTGAGIACTTLGEQGSLTRCGGREIRTPAFSVEVVDTTGAGDAFRAGFIAAWLESGASAELEHCLRYANAVAALNCRALGAQTALPTREEVRQMLSSGGR